jgi:hypothetical protein
MTNSIYEQFEFSALNAEKLARKMLHHSSGLFEDQVYLELASMLIQELSDDEIQAYIDWYDSEMGQKFQHINEKFINKLISKSG